MRVLLVHDGPLENDDPASHAALALAGQLQSAGHTVRALVVTDRNGGDETSLPTARVIAAAEAPNGDLPFSRPTFLPTTGGVAYESLSDDQLTTYRHVIRRRLDHEVDGFNPHIIHCQHIWILGHLALETGVPYVLTAFDAELDAIQVDERYQRFVQQAAENAGRILTGDRALQQRVEQTFPESLGRVVDCSACHAGQIEQLYQEVLRERGVIDDAG